MTPLPVACYNHRVHRRSAVFASVSATLFLQRHVPAAWLFFQITFRGAGRCAAETLCRLCQRARGRHSA